jgi:iron-sulfur cluster assembly protein
MAVTLTEAAARHVTRYLGRRGKGVGVRLGVKTTGCSGLAYKLEYADQITAEDVIFEGHGVKVLVDPKSLPLHRWHRTRLRPRRPQRGLQVPQPTRERRCGCGESFRV